MCGRFTLTIELDLLFERFQHAYDRPLQKDFFPSFNVAPTQSVWSVIRGEKGNKLGRLQWGLVPSWAKDPSFGAKMINARAETLQEKASFKALLHRQRCLVVADSFYEWKKEGTEKQPYRILLKSEKPFAFAGLWSVWKSKKETLGTCTIITTEANRFMSPIHERMPVILKPQDEEQWLNPANSFNDVQTLLTSFPEDDLKMYPISNRVNSARLNDPDLIEPLEVTGENV